MDKTITPESSPPIIAQHNSWISVDPIQGCPANCAYCFLQPLNLTSKAPSIPQHSPDVVYETLANYPYFEKRIFKNAPNIWARPIAIGNQTDICLTPGNRKYLIDLLKHHQKTFPEVVVCIPTKASLKRDFLDTLNSIGVKVVFFISLSFLDKEYEKGTASISKRLENFRLLSDPSYGNIKCIHWWRPVTSINVPNIRSVEEQVTLLKEHNSPLSVVVGLAYGPVLYNIISNDQNPLSGYIKSHAEQNNTVILENRIREDIRTVADKRSYTVFFSTDCALSYVLEKPCYNAGYRKSHPEGNCISSNCPIIQKERCLMAKSEYEAPSAELLAEIAEFLNISLEKVSFSKDFDAILIDAALSQEMQTFLTQATTFSVICETVQANLAWVRSWRTSAFQRK